MNYCVKDQWVINPRTGHIGFVLRIINRRDHERDGEVFVQCGPDGPIMQFKMADLDEATQKEIDIATGVRFHE